MLNYEQMSAVIKGGGTVHHKGVMYNAANPLPSPSHFLADDPSLAGKTEADLDKKIAELQAEREKVRAASKPKANEEGQTRVTLDMSPQSESDKSTTDHRKRG